MDFYEWALVAAERSTADDPTSRADLLIALSQAADRAAATGLAVGARRSTRRGSPGRPEMHRASRERPSTCSARSDPGTIPRWWP